MTPSYPFSTFSLKVFIRVSKSSTFLVSHLSKLPLISTFSRISILSSVSICVKSLPLTYKTSKTIALTGISLDLSLTPYFLLLCIVSWNGRNFPSLKPNTSESRIKEVSVILFADSTTSGNISVTSSKFLVKSLISVSLLSMSKRLTSFFDIYFFQIYSLCSKSSTLYL